MPFGYRTNFTVKANQRYTAKKRKMIFKTEKILIQRVPFKHTSQVNGDSVCLKNEDLPF